MSDIIPPDPDLPQTPIAPICPTCDVPTELERQGWK